MSATRSYRSSLPLTLVGRLDRRDAKTCENLVSSLHGFHIQLVPLHNGTIIFVLLCFVLFKPVTAALVNLVYYVFKWPLDTPQVGRCTR